jgi:hypothetical protein
VIDKLVLLCPLLKRKVVTLLLKEGVHTAGYERFVDARKTKLKLPVKLFYRGLYNHINKIELIGVAELGLPLTLKILGTIVPNVNRLKIYRIDVCVDILGLSPWFFVTNALISHRQNYALYRSRGAVSYYLQFSKQQKIVFYDRLKLLRKQKNPLASIFRAEDRLTRIEFQWMGAAVPYRCFAELHRYADVDPLANLHFRKLIVMGDGRTPTKRLAAYGLRWLISKYGQQSTSRMFPSPEWAALRKAYLERMERSTIPEIGSLMHKSTRRWLEGKILFPRGSTSAP